LAHAAFLTRGNLPDIRDRARHDLIKPAAIALTRTTLDPGRTNLVSGNTMRQEDMSASLGRRLLPLP
jgi:hypothetical protein